MEEHIFATKVIYQTRLENSAKHNTPPMMMVNTRMMITTNANVL
jgi:hypothetical protein